MARRAIEGLRGILTGASSGIGEALARELVAGGGRLLLVARREDRLRQLAESLSAAKGRAEIFVGDVTLPAVRTAAVERAVSLFGGLDLLVNNAGSGAMGRFDEATPERLRQIMEVNFFAPAELIRATLPALRQGANPLVVNVSSVLGHRGVPFCSEYCASKFAMQGLSESLRAELAAVGIDLLVASPARTDTEFFSSAINGHETRWPLVRGIPAATVARRIMRAIRSGRHEVIPSSKGKSLVWANRLFPGIVDRVLARSR
jgi:short-subunit dehydrogenase